MKLMIKEFKSVATQGERRNVGCLATNELIYKWHQVELC